MVIYSTNLILRSEYGSCVATQIILTLMLNWINICHMSIQLTLIGLIK